ncbi:MAG: hypothetical protein IKN54_02130 [Lachnospiraceae bacterium]|nr:hypothetical protein [Lachnospiraceae bacterium]
MRKNYLVMGITVLALAATMTGCAGKESGKSEEKTTTQTTTQDTAEATKSDENEQADKIIDLEYDKEYKVDLDGDGTDENIKLTYNKTDDINHVELKINTDFTTTFDFITEKIQFSVVDMNTADKEKEIVVENAGMSSDYETEIYKYSANKLEKIDVKKCGFFNFYGQNVVTISTRTDYQFGTGYNVEEVYTYENGEFTKALDYALYSDKWETHINERNVINATSTEDVIDELIKIREEDNKDKVFFASAGHELFDYSAKDNKFESKDMLDKYTAFNVTKVAGEYSADDYIKCVAMEIKTTDGKEGWVKLPKNLDEKDEKKIEFEDWDAAGASEVYNDDPASRLEFGYNNGIMFPIYLAD